MTLRRIVLLAFLVVGGGLAWWLGSPLIIDETVDEPFEATAEATVLATGSFRDVDRVHRGSGSATVFEMPDGRRVLRFDDFEVTNGPDLRVLVATHPDPPDADALDEAGYVELAPLKGNIGSQNYEIPADLDLTSAGSIVIYCRPFHVLFSVAPLQ
jgi:hypothetical protein